MAKAAFLRVEMFEKGLGPPVWNAVWRWLFAGDLLGFFMLALMIANSFGHLYKLGRNSGERGQTPPPLWALTPLPPLFLKRNSDEGSLLQLLGLFERSQCLSSSASADQWGSPICNLVHPRFGHQATVLILPVHQSRQDSGWRATDSGWRSTFVFSPKQREQICPRNRPQSCTRWLHKCQRQTFLGHAACWCSGNPIGAGAWHCVLAALFRLMSSGSLWQPLREI